MLIFLQFTLSDKRNFVHLNETILNKPTWPIPYPFKEFVKGSGQIVERTKGGLDNWIGENYICKISKGIKIKNVGKLRNVAKHQFSNENGILTKYEFVFKFSKCPKLIDRQFINKVIEEILDLQVLIKTTGYKYIPTKFTHFKEDLKKFHIQATTKKESIDYSEHLNYIHFCTPQIYFYLDKNEKLVLRGRGLSHITKTKNFLFEIYSFLYNKNNNAYRIWIHSKTTLPSLILQNREMRISILRLHSEYECLNNVLTNLSKKLINVKPRSPQSDKLQFYLNETIKSVTKQQNKFEEKIGEKNSLEYFKHIFYSFNPGNHDNLLRSMREFDFRPQITTKTINYVNNIEIMNNKYNTTNSQIGALGDNAKSDGNNFQQTNYNIPEGLDFQKLNSELETLKKYAVDNLSDKKEIVISIDNAIHESEKKNANGVVHYLKEGGKWVLDTATKIGISIVSEIIKSNMK